MESEGKHFEPEFISRLQCDSVNEGENAVLICKVSGGPMPEMKWFTEDGIEITDKSDRHELSYSLDTGDVQMVIKNVKPSDEMSYKCVATNQYGTSKTLGLLLIKSNKTLTRNSPSPIRSPTGSPKTGGRRSYSPLKNIEVPPSNLLPVKEEAELSSQSEDVPEASKTQATVPSVEEPFIGCKVLSEPPKTIEAKEGEDIKITCNITGNPEPEILWFKDNLPLKDDYRIDIYSDRGARHLEICDAKTSDSGEYTIVARNQAQQVHGVTKVIVVQNPEKVKRPNIEGLYQGTFTRQETYRPPQFITKPTNQLVHEGKRLKIFCKVSGIPQPEIFWFRDGKQIKKKTDADDNRISYTYEIDDCSYFEIENVSILDTGEYTCTASNVMGAVYCAIKINVEAMTEPETCSEVYSDIEKSMQESENGSRRRSPTDNNTDTSISLTTSNLKNKEIADKLVEKYASEHRRLSSTGAHSDSEREILMQEYVLLTDYKDEQREISLFKDDIIEVLDISKPEKWLVRTKYANLVQVCYLPPSIIEPIDKDKTIQLDLEFRSKQAVMSQRKIKIDRIVTSSEFKSKTESEMSAMSSTTSSKLVSSSSALQQSASNDSNTIYTKTAKQQQSATMSSKTLTTKLSSLNAATSTSMTSSMSSSAIQTAELTTSSSTCMTSSVMTTSASSSSVQTAVVATSLQISKEDQENIEAVIDKLEAADAAAKKSNTIASSSIASVADKTVASVANSTVTSRRAVLHKKFADRRTQSHDSDPNILESTSSSEDLKTMADELDIYYASCDFTSSELQNVSSTLLSLVENQFVEILDSQDSRYYLVKTRPRKDENSKIGWIPACFLEKRSTSIGQVNRRITREVFRDDILMIGNKQQESIVKKNYSFAELIDMENRYVRDLQFIIENYLHELSRLDSPKLIKEKREFIFANIEDIFAFHKVLFLTQLLESNGDSDQLGKLFLKNRSNFELYVPYSLNRQYSESTLNSYEIIRDFFDSINLRINHHDNYISDYLSRPLDRIVQYRQFLQEQIKYSVRAKQNSTSLQEAYFMFCDIFKIIETRQLVNTIQNLPAELLTKLDKLNRFDAFYIVDAENRLRERILFLFKDNIIICRLKPRTTAETIAFHNNQLGSIVSGSISLANYFKGTLVFKSFIPLSAITSIKMDNFDETDEKLLIEINIEQNSYRDSILHLLNTAHFDQNEGVENLLLNENTRLIIQSKSPYSKLAFIKALKNNLVCLGFLEETIDTLNYLNEELVSSTITSMTSSMMPKKRKILSKKKSIDKPLTSASFDRSTEFQDANESSIYASTSTLVAPNRSSKLKSEEDNEYEDEESSIKKLTKSAMIKTKYDQNLPIVDEYPVIVYASTSSNLAASTHTLSNKREGSSSLSRSGKKSRNSLEKNDVISTDFYSFESARDSTDDTYHTANEEESKPYFSKRLEPTSALEGESAVLECRIVANPEPTIAWYKGNNSLIHDSPNYIHLKEANHVYKLVIREANIRDSGTYKIVATNLLGEAVSTCRLIVNEDVTDQDMTVIDNLEIETNKSDNTDNDVFDDEDNLHISEDSPTILSANELESVKRASNKIEIRMHSSKTIVPINTAIPILKGTKPNFLKLFDSRRVKENSALLLACQAVGEPMPEISWHKDGQEIINGSRINIKHANNGASSLFISRTYLDDAGVYQVTAANDNGISVYQAEVIVEPADDYSIDDDVFSIRSNNSILRSNLSQINERHFTPERLDSGQAVARLKCQVKKDNVKVNWLRDDTMLNMSEKTKKYSMIENGNERVLIVNNVETEDEGEYVCQSGKYRVALYLTINEETTTSEISSDDDRYELYFQDDRSRRSSSSRRSSTTTTTTTKVRRTYTNVKEMFVNEGINHAELKCRVRDPHSNVSWFKDYQYLGDSNNNKYEFISNGNERILIVKNPTRADNGDYVCQSGTHQVVLNLKVNAFNREITPVIMNQTDNDLYVRNEDSYKPLKRATSTSSTLFPIKEQSPIQAITSTITTSSLTSLGQANSAIQVNKVRVMKLENDLEFIKQLEPYTDCDEGRDCILECWVNKFATSAEWFKDNNFAEALNESNKKYEITSTDGRKHRLLIKNTTADDKAIYTCRVNNLLQSNTLLNITEDLPLRILHGLSDLHVPEFENNVQFIVEVNKRVRNDGKSCQIKWFLDKREINLADKNFQMFCIENQVILKFLREIIFEQDNNSHVECRIQEIKHSVQTIELQTKCRIIVDRIKEFSGQFTKKLDDFTQADSGLHLDLEVRVDFDAKEIKWYKNNSEILDTNTAYQLVHDPLNRSYILRLKNCRLKDSGIYTCHVDSLQCSGEVKILETPIKFTQQLQDQFYDLEEDASVTLDCQLNKPPSMFGLRPRWFKNDLEIVGAHTSKYDLIEEHTICALIIYDLDERDEGRYRCQVGNERTECRIKPEYVLTKFLPNCVEPRESESCTLGFSVNRPPNGIYSTPVTKWFKDDKELNEDQNKYWFIEHGENRSLSIQNLNPSDSGLYKALISDETADPSITLVATNSCQVAVKKLKVDFVKPLQSSVVAKPDETVKLYCETVQENLKPKWYCNEVLVETNNNNLRTNKETFSTQTQHFLIINDIKEQDSGQYKIKFGSDLEYCSEVLIDKQACYNLEASVNKQTKATKGFVQPKKTEFLSHLKDVRCNEGDDFEIECILNRNVREVDLIEWKKNNEFFVNSVGSNYNRFNENLLSDSEFEFINAHNKCILRFKNCKRSDAGQYELNIVELDDMPEQGKEPVVIKSKCNVFVTTYVEKSEIVKQLPRTIKIGEGDSIRLECQLNKKPERVQWYRNSIELFPVVPEELHRSSVAIRSLDEGKIQILEITNVQHRDDGTYQLNADDKISICEVKIKPVGAKFDQKPPAFLHFDKKRELEDGNDTLSIECSIDKNLAHVKWFKGNEEIIPGESFDKDKFEIIREGPIQCLLIHDVEASDAGDYYCSLGSEFSKTVVTIDDSPEEPKTPKIFEPKYEKIDVYEGKGLVMGIDLDTNEPSHKCVWYKDAAPVNLETSHIKNEIVENKKHTLKIDKLGMVDSGRYELIMNDLIDNSSLTLAIIDLNVKEKPIAITKKLSAQKVQNSILLLECEVSKSITTDQFVHAWKKDTVEISTDDQHIARNIANEKVCRLYINKFDYVDSGIYEFSVYDVKFPELKETTSFRLDIKQNPFKSGMRVANNDMNKTRLLLIEFETVNDKYGINDMKWKKNNVLMDFEGNEKYSFKQMDINKFSLEIRNIDAQDNGSYICSIDEFSNKLNLTGIENIIQQTIVNYEIQETIHEQNEEEVQNVNEPVVKQQIFVVEEINQLKKDNVQIQRTESLVNLVESDNELEQIEEVDEKIEIENPYIVEEPTGKDDILSGVNIRRAETLTDLIEEDEHAYMFEEVKDVLETVEEESSYFVEEPGDKLDEPNKSLLVKRAQSLANLVEEKDELEDDVVDELKSFDDSHVKVENLTVREFELKDDLADMRSLQIKRAQSLASLIENKEDLHDLANELKAESNLIHETLLVKEVEAKDDLNDSKSLQIKRAQSLANLVDNKEENDETNELKPFGDSDNKQESLNSEEIKEQYDFEDTKSLQIKRAQSLANLVHNKEETDDATNELKPLDESQIKPENLEAEDVEDRDDLAESKSLLIKRAQSLANLVENKEENDETNELKPFSDTDNKQESLNSEEIQEKNELTDVKSLQIKRAQSLANLVDNKEETDDGANELKSLDDLQIKAESLQAEEVQTKDDLTDNKNLKIKRAQSLASLIVNKDEENTQEAGEINHQDKPTAETVKEDTFAGEKLNENAINVKGKPQNMVKESEQTEVVEEVTEFTETIETTVLQSKTSSNIEEKLEDKDSKTVRKPVNQVSAVEEVNHEEKLSDLTTEKINEIKPGSKIEQPEELQKPRMSLSKQLSQVNEVNENVKEESCDHLADKKDNEQHEKAQESEIKDSKDELNKPSDLKHLEKSIEVLKSNWKPFIKIAESENIDLSITINRPPQNIESIDIYKNDVKLDTAKENIVTACRIENIENSEISFNLKEAQPDQSGKYKLCIKQKDESKERELATTDLTIEETPCIVSETIKVDKNEYNVGETINVSFGLSKPVQDKDKCISWLLNNKTIDLKSKQNKVTEVEESKQTIYKLSVESCEIGKNDGEYSVKVKSKLLDKTDVYSGAVSISIVDPDKFDVLESSWTPELKLKEDDNHELFVKISKPLNDIKELTLTKNKLIVNSDSKVKLSYENIKVDEKKENSLIKVNFTESKTTDTGLYKLTIVDKKKRTDLQLGSTNVTVTETPYNVLETLKSDKTTYLTGEDIVISIKLSKPLVDKQKCFVITHNGKALNLIEYLFSEEIQQNFETVYTFKIKSCNPENNKGDYHLKLLSKPNENEFYSGTVKIDVKPQPVEILSKLKLKETKEIFEKEEFTITCKLSTSNLPIKWFKNDKPIDGIQSKSKYLPEKNSDGTYSLTVYTTTSEDSGVYSISLPQESSLSDKSDSNDLKVTVSVKPPVLTIHKDIEVTPSDKLFTKETVNFVVTLSRVSYNYEWHKNGTVIKTDAKSRYSLSTETDKNEKFLVKLTIKELETEDSGEYKLVAEQLESKTVDLSVQKLSIDLKLVVPQIKSSQSIVLEEEDAETLLFECRTNKDFEGRVQWFKNDVTVSLIDAALYKTEKIVENSVFIYKLHAYKPKTTRLVKTVDYNYHAGSYYAQFNSTSKSNLIEIKVNKAPSNEFGENLSYKVLNAKKSDVITEHSTLVFRCTTKLQLKTNTIVKWFKNKTEVEESNTLKITSKNNKEFELCITNCDAERDSGVYKIEIGEYDTKISEELKIEVVKEKLNLEALVIQGDDIHEGGQVVLVAKVSRKPKRVEWLKDGKALSFKDKRFLPSIEEEDIKLKIDNLQLSDNSIYTLKVDDSESSYKLVVNELPVKFVKELAYEVVSSEDKSNNQDCLRFSCMANKSLNLNDNKYSIKWFKDGNVIKSEQIVSSVQAKGSKIPTKINTNKYEQSSEDEKKTHILYVNSLDKNDFGKYEIRIYESQTETMLVQSSISLKLSDIQKYLPVEPAIVGDFECSNEKPSEGQNVSVTAKLSVPIDRKLYKLQWYVNKEPVEHSRKFPRYFMENKKDMEPFFEIIDLKPTEEACEIELALVKLDNNAEVSRKSIKLREPERLERQVRSLKDLGIVKIKEGETISLKVRFDRNISENDIKLYFNDKEFVPSEHGSNVEIRYRPEIKEYIVQIGDAQTARDEGRYKIQTPNSKSDCQVMIEEKPLKIITELENFKLKILPAIVFEQGETDKNREAFESHFSRSATFECILSKYFTEVSWCINEILIEKTIKDYNRYKISSSEDGKIHTLVIKNCTLADNELNVQIKLNRVNKKSSAVLKVDQMPFDYLIKLKRPLDDCRAKEGDVAIFQCDISLSATLEPLNLEILPEWFKKDDKLTITNNTKYEVINDVEKNSRSFKLKVKNCVAAQDAGEYSCHFFINNNKTDLAKNVPIVQSHANLTIKENETRLVSELEPSVTVNQGEAIELECELSKPDLAVEWFKDGKVINSKESSVKITTYTKSEGRYCYKLRIENADVKQSGRYKLQFKTIVSECKVVVKEPKLSVKASLQVSFTVKENSDAEFTTEFSQSIASDFYRIEWFKSGKRLYFSNKSLKYRMNLDESKMSLAIKDCTDEDVGDYEVKVYSGLEDKPLAQKTNLTVQPLEVVILEKLRDITVNEGETAKLAFRASKPCSCQWYKVNEDPKQVIGLLEKNPLLLNNKAMFEQINADDRIVFSLKPDNMFGLTIHDAKTTENGYYMAYLKSSNIESKELIVTWAQVVVNQVLIEIKLSCPETVSITESSKLIINCSLSKIPTENVISRIKAFKNDKLIPLSTEDNKTIYELVSVGNKTDSQLQFVIDNIKIEDAGKYSLKLDESKASCHVKVVESPVVREKFTPSFDEIPKIIQDLSTQPVEHLSTEPFSITLIVEGDDLRCEWYHDDKKVIPLTNQVEFIKLDSPNRYEFVFNFNNPFISDSGKYQCRISNRHGSVMSATAHVKIKDPKEAEKEVDESLFQSKPRFIEYFSDVYMEQATEAQFKCKIIGKPEPKVVWCCNCRKITANEKFELLKDETDHYTLIVKNVNFNDEGEYTCKASNSKGETSWSANLYLNENMNKKTSPVNEKKPSKGLVAPNFLRKIKDSTVSEGSSAKFDCFIDGEPFPRITWFKNNSAIDLAKNSEKYKLEIDEISSKVSFTINNTDKAQDEDEYLIKLENDAGASQCSAYLVVEPSEDDANKMKRKVRFSLPQDSDVFLIPLHETEIPKPPGEPTICDYKTTNLILKWTPSPSDLNFYNEEDRDIDSQSNVRYVIEYRTSKSYSWSVFASNINCLSTYVDNLFPGLIYSFRVRAENSSGISDASTAVSTKYLKDSEAEVTQKSSADLIDQVNNRLSKYRRETVMVSEKPAIIGDSKDVRYYIEGQTAEVTIQVFGYPSPQIKWMRNNTELISDDKSYMIYSDRLSNHHLAILNATEKDEGPYQLVASNENGTCVHEFYLQQADPPVFLEPFKDVTVENHQDVQMTCKVDGIPYPEVKFYKDWHLLAESYRIKIKHIEPDTWIIRINGAIVRDSGLYTCTAKNIAGGTLCSCNLNVAESLLNLPHPDLKTNLITFQRKKFEEDYEIVEQICQSLNSKIYRVIERRTAKEYIAKMTSGQKYKDWIRSEADCLNQVNQITESLFVRMHDAYETPNKSLILIFDEIKGKNIIESIVSEKNMTKQNCLEEKKVALYVKQLLECLNSLHSRNIVHLDVNPDNIIIDHKTKRLKLIGFTHSKSLKPEVYSSSAKEAVFHDYGQPEYVAPEIVMNKPVTLNTDMWSLGVLTYTLLAGKSPFFGETIKDTLENIANCKWSFNDEFTNISLDAKDFIQKLFINEPKERMTSEQALSHPWIRYATQQLSSSQLSKTNLIQLHSRRVWANQAKQMQPWLKLVKVSELLEEIDTSDLSTSKVASHVDSDEIMNIGCKQLKDLESNKSIVGKRNASIQNESFDEVNIVEESTTQDDENLNPGTYLLPVKDPLFTVRIREYRRTRYDSKKMDISTRSPSYTDMRLNRATPTVKERYHIDVYGKCIQRGSLSRSIEPRTSIHRASESPGNSNYDALTKPFQNFLDHRNDKRNIVGEGSAPIIREKLKDMYLIVGSIVTMRCKIEGNPTPRCFWYHNDRLIIGDDERFKFAQTEDGVITLSIYKARVSDIGVYRCAARNRFGVSITNAKLTVGDTPDRPTRPIVAQHSSDQVYLIWESPSFNGNSDILCYKVDYKTSNDVKWSNALFTTEECCLIKDLQPLTSYRFRVSCINTIGVSSFSWASEEVTTLAPGKSKITIDNDQAEKLLKNQYNLEKRSQQLVLVKKLDEEMKGPSYKKSDIVDEFRLQMNHNPSDLYTLENKLYKFGDMAVYYGKDNAHETKRLIKYNTKINDNEIKILRELRDQDRMVQLIEGFHFNDLETNKTMYALVYAHAVPVTDFISTRHKYSEELVVKILRQLLDAVQWLHLHGFVHLNINPLTVLNGNHTQVNVKLGGLENAVQISELAEQNIGAAAASVQTKILQPVEFSAPEIINKETLSMATDVWSIGVFAALLLSGSSLFLHHTDPETTKANITFCRLTFEEFYDDVTGEAVLFIQQCLKRSPSNRLSLQECIDHKMLSLSVTGSKKRENIIFLTEKLKCFNHEFSQRL